MKKLSFMVVVMLVVFVANFSHGEIIEKNTQRYFKLGDQEYVCNADNRISDESAENILKRVRKIYNSKNNKKEDGDIVEDVWTSLHKVYSGEAYDEILFICLRYKLNKLFAYLQGKDWTNDEMCNFGQLLSIRVTPRYVSGRSLNNKVRVGCKTTTYLLDAIVKETYVEEVGYGSSLDSARQYMSREWSNSGKYEQKAIDNFCGKVDQLLNYWLSKADAGSYILEDQWDELLVKIPQRILIMGKSWRSCMEYLARELAGKLLGTSLKYVQTEDAKKELISFGKKESLEFVVPKTKEVIEKQLF